MELKAGTNLHDAGKCTCGSRLCGPSARGLLTFSSAAAGSSMLRDTVTLSGALPANPYDTLRDATSTLLVCAPPCE